MYTLDKNNTSPSSILYTLMPQIIPLLTLMLVHTWYEQSKPQGHDCPHLTRKNIFTLTSYDICISTQILKLEIEMTIFIIYTSSQNETILISIQWSRLFVELEVPTIGPHTCSFNERMTLGSKFHPYLINPWSNSHPTLYCQACGTESLGSSVHNFLLKSLFACTSHYLSLTIESFQRHFLHLMWCGLHEEEILTISLAREISGEFRWDPRDPSISESHEFHVDIFFGFPLYGLIN